MRRVRASVRLLVVVRALPGPCSGADECPCSDDEKLWGAPFVCGGIMYVRQPHAVFVQERGQVVLTFTSANTVWAASVPVERLQKACERGQAGTYLGPDKILATPIFSGAGQCSWPILSPSGHRVAFSNDQSGNSEIYVVDLAAVQVASAANVYAAQAVGSATRLTYLAATSSCVGWGAAQAGNYFRGLGAGAEAGRLTGGETAQAGPAGAGAGGSQGVCGALLRPVIHFVSDCRESNVAHCSLWSISPAGGAPLCSDLGESDFYHFCDALQLHVVGRYVRDSHCTATWKVRVAFARGRSLECASTLTYAWNNHLSSHPVPLDAAGI